MAQHIDPERAQFEEFKNLPRDTPIMMLNLVLLKDQADYKDAREATGAQAYANYGKESAPIISKVGGEVIWRGTPENVLIGPSSEQWHFAFIIRYPTAGAFLQMVTDPDYQAIVYHRQAAVQDSRLIRMGDADSDKTFAEL